MSRMLPLAVVASLGCAEAACGQVFEPRAAFRSDWTNNGTPNVDPQAGLQLDVSGGPASVEMQSLFGPFSAGGEGAAIRGLFNFIGSVTLLDPAGTASISARRDPVDPGTLQALRGPYHFANITTEVSPTLITFDANRGLGDVILPVGGHTIEQLLAMTNYPPTQGGPNAYFPGLRFFVHTGEGLSERTVTLTISGQMQTFTDWFNLGSLGGDFEAHFLPMNFVTDHLSVSIPVHIPAAGSWWVLAAIGLAVRRRHRC